MVTAVASRKLANEAVREEEAVEVMAADAADVDKDEDVVEDVTEMTWSIMVWMCLTITVHSLTMR